LVSQLTDGLFQAYLIAQIVFLDPEKHNTAVGVAKAYAVLVIPFSVLGPAAGVLIDRWSRRRILAITPVVKGVAALALLPLAGGSLILYVPALAVVSLNRFYLTAATSSIPVLVQEENLLVANSMSTVGGTVATFVGIVAGTKLVDPIGTFGLLLLIAAGWPVAGLLATRIASRLRAGRKDRLRASAPISEDLARVVADLWTGVRRLAATPAALASIVTISFDQFLIGFVTVLSLVVFKQRFHQGVGSYGNLVAAGGVGVLVGTLTVGWLEPLTTKPRIVAMAFFLSGLVSLAVAPAIIGITVLLVSFVIGLTFAWRKIPVDTMVQEVIPNRFRGRVFAAYDLTYSMARVVAAGLAVLAIPRLSAGTLLFLTGAVYLLWAPVLPWWARRPRWVTVRFYSGGRAEEVPRSVLIGGEEEPVELLGSWTEERNGERLRRLRLGMEDGTRIDVAALSDPGSRWRIEREHEGTPDSANEADP
jgi:MFS family permease